jgi:hypothetical protein
MDGGSLATPWDSLGDARNGSQDGDAELQWERETQDHALRR